jgi:phage gp46-like protein
MDMRLEAEPLGGDLVIKNGAFKFEDSLYTAIYTSLFTAPLWWGFAGDIVPLMRGSEVEELVSRGYDAQNRLSIKAAAEKSLAWITAGGYARSVHCEVIVKSKISAEIRAVLIRNDGGSETILLGI